MPKRLQPFVFFTDGGVCQNEFCYSMHQIFGKGDYLYSSKYLNDKEMEKGVNIQTYLGREAQHGMLNLSEIRKVPTDPRVLQLSIE